MAYRIAAIPMTLSDLHGFSSNGIFRTVVQQLTRFQLTVTVGQSLSDSLASYYIQQYD